MYGFCKTYSYFIWVTIIIYSSILDSSDFCGEKSFISIRKNKNLVKVTTDFKKKFKIES